MLPERTVGGLHTHLLSLLSQLNISPATSVLDIGCGSGALLERLRQRGSSRLIGIDGVLPGHVDGIEFRRFDIDRDDPSTLGQFGLVSCIEVIEHVENVGRLLDAIRATLTCEGTAIITTPNIEALRARVRALMSGRYPSFDDKSDPTHLMPILHYSLQKMLARRNLQISNVLQYPAERSKTLMFRRGINVLSTALRIFLPDGLYGDNTIYVVKHCAAK